jgi:hypothetical protein
MMPAMHPDATKDGQTPPCASAAPGAAETSHATISSRQEQRTYLFWRGLRALCCPLLFMRFTRHAPEGLTRNLLAIGLLHPPPPVVSLSMPYAMGGGLTPAGCALLSLLSPTGTHATAPPIAPSISARNFSLRRTSAGVRVFMLFDTDMLLPPPQKSPKAQMAVGSDDVSRAFL